MLSNKQNHFPLKSRNKIRKWCEPQTYLDKINNTKGLKELLGAPFLLRMFIAILPELNAEKLTLIDIYKSFITY